MMARIFVLGIIIFSISACTTSSTEEECTTDLCIRQQAYDKVIKVHDEVMPKLSQISDLKGRIEAKMNEASDSASVASWQGLMVDLDVADEAMWVWMRQFNSDLEEVSLDEALEYLQEEQTKVDAVAEKINAAIGNAEERLK